MRVQRAPFVLVAALIIAAARVGGSAGAAAAPPDQEEAARTLQSEASNSGALGFYADDQTSDFVIVIPSSVADKFVIPTTKFEAHIRVQVRPIEQADIDAALQTLKALAADPDLGLQYLSFWFDPSIGLVRATGNLDPSAVVTRLGTAAAFVAYSDGPAAVATSRWADYPPFWGGDEIYAALGSCTGGFPVQSGTTGYMATAAHCFQNGAHVYSPGSGLEVGKVVKWRDFLTYNSDLELLGNKTYQGRVYVGDLYSGSFQPVKGSGDPVTAVFQYCFSGVTSSINSSERCGFEVTTLDSHQCFTDGGHFLGCADHEMLFRDSAGNVATQLGDSGAPFYRYVTGGISARGLVNGTCPDGAHPCYGYGFRWTQVASQLSVSITTYP
jgi:hypothetical protein